MKIGLELLGFVNRLYGGMNGRKALSLIGWDDGQGCQREKIYKEKQIWEKR